MKALIISLFLFFTVNAQNVWYVNRDATGANTGRNWANAWNYFDSTSGNPYGINWAIIGAGDSIYVSGGSDSTVYLTPPGIYSHAIYPPFSVYGLDGITFDEEVVIAPAWQSGHNGGVYISPRNNNCNWVFEIHNISNIKLTGFNFVDTRTNEEGAGFYLGGYGVDGYEYRDSNITIENSHILGNGRGTLAYLSGYKITLRDNWMEQPENDYLDDQDPIGVSGGRGGHTIDGNTIIMRNGNNFTDAHRDGIQFSNMGYPVVSGERKTITISNNLIIDTNPEGAHWNNMIYNYGWTGTNDTRFLIYNNVIVNRKTKTGVGGIAIGRYYEGSYTEHNSIFMFNNTIISKGHSGSMFTGWAIDTLVMKNNIFIKDSLAPNILNLENTQAYWNAVVRDIDNNHYAEYGGISSPFAVAGGVNRTWAQWQSDGFDANGSSGNSTAVTFANKYGLDIEDYYTATGRDAGENLWDEYPFLRYDILGNERTENGDWDMGALEFTGGQSNNVNVKSKVFLQGPFNTNSMLTSLNQGSLLPNSQPYNSPPWNYSGNESFTSGPSSSMVDWVLVELRNASNPTQIVARRAAVLKNDGLLLNTSGSDGVVFNNVNPGSYYIAIYHRNHLAIMSAAPVPLSSNSALYDFTTGMNKAYGQNPMVELVTGKFGMYATDGNADGIVNIVDRDNVWLIQNGNMGYLEGDFNMNSGVTVHDVNQLWNLNNGKTTQVP